MPKVLTKLRIDEVSAVDRGAGDGTKIILMKRDDTPRSKPHVERHARRLRKNCGRSFNEIMKAMADHDDASGDSIRPPAATHHASTIADLLIESGRFSDRTAALDHLLNTSRGQALLQRNKAADQTGRESSTMDKTETLRDIAKAGGIVVVSKAIDEENRDYGIAGEKFVEIASESAQTEFFPLLSKAQAFDKLCERWPVVLRAYNVLKAAEFAVKPQVFGREAMNPDQPTDMLAAYNEILRTIRERFPYRTGAQQLAMADEELARRYHVRPEANHANVYAMPLETRATEKHVEKRDGLRGDAYATLMAKAEQLRSERPELSVAQCFDRIYTSRGNVELAKRERIESAPR
jgi:hypothetical protein